MNNDAFDLGRDAIPNAFISEVVFVGLVACATIEYPYLFKHFRLGKPMHFYVLHIRHKAYLS